MVARIPHWVDGAERPGTSGRPGPVLSPATGEQTGQVDLANSAGVDAVVASATEAARGWREASLSRRAAVLFAFWELLPERADELAQIVTSEHGDVLSDAKGEVARGLENAEFPVGFVGSTPVARYVYETGTRHGKRVQALGGAKNHLVVLPDADLDLAADAAVSAAYVSAGERCMAISVVVAVGAVADPLVEAIASRLPKVRVGPGTDPDAQMGPLITREHRDRMASSVEQGAAAGATVVADGRRANVPGDGFFLGVSLLDNVTPEMSVYTVEIFGPVLCVVRAQTYAEAVDLVNRNPYGNGVALFTRDGGAARQFQFDVQAGMVGINVPIPVPVAYYSFGGWKASLFGDTHMYGPDGVALLHPHQGRDIPLARPGNLHSGPRLPRTR